MATMVKSERGVHVVTSFYLRPERCLADAATILAFARRGTVLYLDTRGMRLTWRSVAKGAPCGWLLDEQREVEAAETRAAVLRTTARLRSIGLTP